VGYPACQFRNTEAGHQRALLPVAPMHVAVLAVFNVFQGRVPGPETPVGAGQSLLADI
jgi:hypothetical protein